MLKDWPFDLLNKAFSVWFDLNKRATVLTEPVEYPSEEDRNREIRSYYPTSSEIRSILRDFQAEGAIKILQEYNFGRWQEPYKWSVEIVTPKFYQLEAKIKKQMLRGATLLNLPQDSKLPPAPTQPHGWELSETDPAKPCFKYEGEPIYTFPNSWSDKYRYFKCIWQNYGAKVPYKMIYEFEKPELKYPDKGIWRINRNIRSTINKLRKEFVGSNINIETNKGLTLSIS